jgi:hypothetical protein
MKSHTQKHRRRVDVPELDRLHVLDAAESEVPGKMMMITQSYDNIE